MALLNLVDALFLFDEMPMLAAGVCRDFTVFVLTIIFVML